MLQPKILDLEPIKPYRLRLYYETEEIKIFDVEPYIKGAWYGELRNSAYFNAVRITGNGFGVEWPNGQDVAPHELYDESVNCPTWDPGYTQVTLEETAQIKAAKERGFILESEIDRIISVSDLDFIRAFVIQ